MNRYRTLATGAATITTALRPILSTSHVDAMAPTKHPSGNAEAKCASPASSACKSRRKAGKR
eukprot:CAMPEP_0183412722 /NCGR_PEP_ID=MMETSP0370-20130417/21213_1 /TAXON_ID=268820 /ORGANISM="Peridinium aciculiferum, Strain PAER-2" /LENGTH=61 /DNA_ID=CAMNT_0025595853 /DNA_START=30 /DNA_END=215 /DNA_ORIENTATION=+